VQSHQVRIISASDQTGKPLLYVRMGDAHGRACRASPIEGGVVGHLEYKRTARRKVLVRESRSRQQLAVERGGLDKKVGGGVVLGTNRERAAGGSGGVFGIETDGGAVEARAAFIVTCLRAGARPRLRERGTPTWKSPFKILANRTLDITIWG
jgi:hypothetical protein